MHWTRFTALSGTGLTIAALATFPQLTSAAPSEPIAQAQIAQIFRRPRPRPTPAPSPSDVGQQMVMAHNQWRSKVGVAPLRWSSTLATYAQEWANYLAANDKFEHRANNKYGENLFWASGKRWSPSEVVGNWADEVKNYTYINNSCQGVCGHYTQIIWRNTTEVGCAVARSGNQEVWVCNYNPPGNYVGQRPY